MTYRNPDDVHCAAVIIKKFLRELPEPIMTFKLYDAIVTSTCKYDLSCFLVFVCGLVVCCFPFFNAHFILFPRVY